MPFCAARQKKIYKQERIEGHLDEEILERLNSEFDTDDFLKIYFNTFVIQ